MTSVIPFKCHARYWEGIKWCFFQVKCGEIVASFRLHMDEKKCWDLFKAIDTEYLHPTPDPMNTIFQYGSKKTKEKFKTGEKIDIDEELSLRFEWLDKLLACPDSTWAKMDHGKKFLLWCEYSGVEFNTINVCSDMEKSIQSMSNSIMNNCWPKDTGSVLVCGTGQDSDPNNVLFKHSKNYGESIRAMFLHDIEIWEEAARNGLNVGDPKDYSIKTFSGSEKITNEMTKFTFAESGGLTFTTDYYVCSKETMSADDVQSLIRSL